MENTVTREQIRQALCRRHTEAVQEKLSAACVAVAGLGGLGSHIAVFLPGSVWGICTWWILIGWI